MIHEEYQYLEALKSCIAGELKTGRNGDTYGFAGNMMRFKLYRETKHERGVYVERVLPLLTTKFVSVRHVLGELIKLFIPGKTDTNILKKENIHIWDGNTNRETLDKMGFTDREEGDAGPFYSHQWRHFNAEYKGPHADYTGQGIDQLAEVIAEIKTNPNSRRLLVSAWNPVQLKEMCLPPCHFAFQFYVANNKISIIVYQRSADMPLGVPYNIASYSLLLHMVSHIVNIPPGELIYFTGDNHIYSNQIPMAKEQITRQPYPFPTLLIVGDPADIGGFDYNNFIVQNYKHHPKIDYPFST